MPRKLNGTSVVEHDSRARRPSPVVRERFGLVDWPEGARDARGQSKERERLRAGGNHTRRKRKALDSFSRVREQRIVTNPDLAMELPLRRDAFAVEQAKPRLTILQTFCRVFLRMNP